MLCHFYGWTVDYCLDLPVRTFFAMHKQARHMEIRQYAELADQAILPALRLDVYFRMKERYAAMLDGEAPKLPEKPGGPVLEAGSDDARAALTNVVMRKKRFMGLDGGRRR